MKRLSKVLKKSAKTPGLFEGWSIESWIIYMNQKNLTMTMIRILLAGKIGMRMMICTIERKVYKPAGFSVSMEEVDLEAGLRSLRDSLQQMKALLAWKQLKQSESRPGQPPSFTIDDHVETDLRNEYSFFLSTMVKIHHLLNDGPENLSETEKQAIRRQLTWIDQEANRLNLHQSFLYPLKNEYF